MEKVAVTDGQQRLPTLLESTFSSWFPRGMKPDDAKSGASAPPRDHFSNNKVEDDVRPAQLSAQESQAKLREHVAKSMVHSGKVRSAPELEILSESCIEGTEGTSATVLYESAANASRTSVFASASPAGGSIPTTTASSSGSLAVGARESPPTTTPSSTSSLEGAGPTADVVSARGRSRTRLVFSLGDTSAADVEEPEPVLQAKVPQKSESSSNPPLRQSNSEAMLASTIASSEDTPSLSNVRSWSSQPNTRSWSSQPPTMHRTNTGISGSWPARTRSSSSLSLSDRRQPVVRVHTDWERRRALLDVEQWLSKNGFEGVNCSRRRLRTQYPLHVAVRECDHAVIRKLLIAQADATLTDSAGRTPLELAQSKNRGGSHTTLLLALRPAPKHRQVNVFDLTTTKSRKMMM